MIKVRFVSPYGLYKEVEASMINCRSTDGCRGILPNHMPLVLMLEISRFETIENGERKEYAISGGLLYFENNVATVLVNSIESQDEIDLNRAEESKKRAEERINKHKEGNNIDLKRAEISLARALNRISVSGY